ncbi:tetratricopeptide repeat protein [Streptomyces syringium]|uniref:Tetratricopeptide (TPR) repeat protein n=1 Tax=Streptomyces syringium TaxID=76729 RepID=A0ABS4Y7Q3_9ACTN|nr:tetratricopeptide repeat protein [Streptomyces syringium]MBP2404813.1 tetratricopeptide (TPR) repeat protein [Streptomyces syringium]
MTHQYQERREVQGEASGPGAVAVGSNHGIISTGDAATIDNRTLHLPAEALRAPAEVPAPPGLNNLPAPRSAVFVGRVEDLARLGAAMDGGGAATVVHGLGGMGKSTLALHYAHRHRDRYNPVWWVPAETPDGITLALASLAAHLDPYANLTASASAEGAAWATAWLQSHEGWLLVLDNAEAPDDLAPVIGPLTTGQHLITSRRATGWHHLARPLGLRTLAPDASTDLLMRIIGEAGGAGQPGGPDDGAVLAELAAELGHLPLALTQAAAYIQHTAITPASYLARLRRHPARMFAASATDNHERTVARVWQLTLQAIAARDPLAVDILRTFAWLGPDDVPRDLAEALDDDPIAVDEALALLHAYSMITLTPLTFTVHRLVQAVARTPDPADPHRAEETIEEARRRAIGLLGAALPEDPLFNVAGRPRWRALLPHIEALADHVPPARDDEETDVIWLLTSAFLQSEVQLDRAVGFAERSMAASQRLHGPDAPRTLASRSVLASAYRAAGDLERAITLHERNRDDCERVFGAAHEETLMARANLAYAHGLAGDVHLAAELHSRNLADCERLLGPDDKLTLVSRNNLASAYREAGDLDRAISLHEQSTADYARVFGPGHPETLTARSNLAYTYQLAGDLTRAIPLHEAVLTARERALGPTHPHTTLAHELLTNARAAAASAG